MFPVDCININIWKFFFVFFYSPSFEANMEKKGGWAISTYGLIERPKNRIHELYFKAKFQKYATAKNFEHTLFYKKDNIKKK